MNKYPVAVVATLAALSLSTSVNAGSFSRLASFGVYPIDGVLAADATGNLLVETDVAVIELTAASGYTSQRTIHTFSDESLGIFPEGGVTLAGRAILGVTLEGDPGVSDPDGSVFNLGTEHTPTPVSLHNFVNDSSAGFSPRSGLTAGPQNRYFGTTQYGGTGEFNGTVFEVSPAPDNPRFSSIYGFGSSYSTPAPGGSYPTSGRLAVDNSGRLYGATTQGGIYSGGVVFSLQKIAGIWQEQAIFGFSSVVGQLRPVQGSNVVVGPSGGLYICTGGGQYGYGGIVKLALNTHGSWNETTIYEFGARAYDPDVQGSCGITMDPVSGTIVGVTDLGGRSNIGTLFTLTPLTGSSGQWEFAVVHEFAGGRDGEKPTAAPLKLGSAYYGSSPASGLAQSVVWRYEP